MKGAKIIQVHHPSGKMYEAWERFVAAHPEPSFFQSPAFVRLIDSSPGAEWVLLLALSNDALKDPGAGWSGALHDQATAVSKQQQAFAPLGSKAEQPVDPGNILASLLALIVSEEEPQAGLWKALRGWHKSLTACTLVYNGPLLAPGTRLQQERTLKALLEALNRLVKKRSPSTQFINSQTFNDFLPLFKELGYARREHHMLPVIDHSTETGQENQKTDPNIQTQACLKKGVLTISNPRIKLPVQLKDMLNDPEPEINRMKSDLISFHKKNRPLLHFLASVSHKTP